MVWTTYGKPQYNSTTKISYWHNFKDILVGTLVLFVSCFVLLYCLVCVVFYMFVVVRHLSMFKFLFIVAFRKKEFSIIHYLYMHIVWCFSLIAGLWWDGDLMCIVTFGWFRINVLGGVELFWSAWCYYSQSLVFLSFHVAEFNL